MKLSKTHKVFWIFLIISVYGPVHLSFASSLEDCLNYEINNNIQPMNLANSKETEIFQQKDSGPDEYVCMMNMGKAHKYLGYGTLLLAATAAVSGGDNAFHKGAGVAAAAMAVATCVTGYMEYSNYFDIDNGLSAHNVHIVLGTLAAIGFVATAASAINSDNKNHAGIGVGSTALLVVPIVVVNW